MLSWAVWFKFLLNEVIANTCLFIVTSFSKQSASWKLLEICEMCALSTDSPKTYPVNKYMYTGSNSYSFDWGGGEESEKTQFPFSVASAFQNGNTAWEDVWSFPYMYTGSSSYSLDCGGGGRKERKRPNFPFLLHQPSKMETLHEKMLGLFRYFLPAPLTKLLFPS